MSKIAKFIPRLSLSISARTFFKFLLDLRLFFDHWGLYSRLLFWAKSWQNNIENKQLYSVYVFLSFK